MSADHEDVKRAQKALTGSLKKLHGLVPEVGMARQIIEYDGDRRKALLAKYVVKYLKDGEGSATKADAWARADEAYIKELSGLADVCSQAHATRADWDATMASFEGARSIHSMIRAIALRLPEVETP